MERERLVKPSLQRSEEAVDLQVKEPSHVPAESERVRALEREVASLREDVRSIQEDLHFAESFLNEVKGKESLYKYVETIGGLLLAAFVLYLIFR